MLQALWHGIWADNSPPGKIIVLIILGLLVWAVRAGSRHHQRYRREEDNLSKLAAKLRETMAPKATVSEGGEAADTEPRPEQRHVSPADLASLRQDLAPDSLIAERLEAIEKLRTRQVRVNPGALQQLSLARDEARPGMAVPGTVAGLATMLGLLGTFIGLAIMVQQVQFVLPQSSGAVTVDSWTQSVENISKVLGGIKTAFSTSLVGIVCSIMASLLNFRMRSAQALFFERMERFTTEELLPAAVPAVEDESLLERVSLQLENSFVRLDDIYRQNQDALKDMTGAQRAFVDIVEEIRKITRSEASRNLEGVLEQLSQTNRSVLSVVDQLPKVVTAVESGQRRLTERLSSILSSAAPAALPSQSTKPQITLATTLVLVLAVLALALFFFKA
ncbi:MAG TPA: MotA/TolQ/ExbB proton channel family protein [Thermoanaerobaculia bacterium]|nr:MotA/TolQ/ExbB proton channel family protein [Thermoanaerobaculia bacterium]